MKYLLFIVLLYFPIHASAKGSQVEIPSGTLVCSGERAYVEAALDLAGSEKDLENEIEGLRRSLARSDISDSTREWNLRRLNELENSPSDVFAFHYRSLVELGMCTISSTPILAELWILRSENPLLAELWALGWEDDFASVRIEVPSNWSSPVYRHWYLPTKDLRFLEPAKEGAPPPREQEPRDENGVRTVKLPVRSIDEF